jgi:hypothetical protein
MTISVPTCYACALILGSAGVERKGYAYKATLSILSLAALGYSHSSATGYFTLAASVVFGAVTIALLAQLAKPSVNSALNTGATVAGSIPVYSALFVTAIYFCYVRTVGWLVLGGGAAVFVAVFMALKSGATAIKAFLKSIKFVIFIMNWVLLTVVPTAFSALARNSAYVDKLLERVQNPWKFFWNSDKAIKALTMTASEEMKNSSWFDFAVLAGKVFLAIEILHLTQYLLGFAVTLALAPVETPGANEKKKQKKQ